MLLKIYGTDKEKERTVNLLRDNKIAFDFPPNIPNSAEKGTLMLFSESGKGKSKFEENTKDLIGGNEIRDLGTFSQKVSKEDYEKVMLAQLLL